MTKSHDDYKAFWESDSLDEAKLKIASVPNWDTEWVDHLKYLNPTGKSWCRVMDIGCGVGRIASKFPCEEIVGVDIARSMLEMAPWMVISRHGFRAAKTYDWRLVDSDNVIMHGHDHGTFDYVYSLMTFQHLPIETIRAYLKQLPDGLAPGGQVCIQTRVGKLGDTVIHGHHFENGDHFASEFESAGLTVSRVDVGGLHPDWIWVYAEKGN